MNQTPTLVSKTQKDILSRLLATEDIIVEHSKIAPTAMFDVKNRILILPMWKEMSTRLYDMLVGHEVGHALFTPMHDASGRDLPVIIKDIAGNAGDEAFVKGLLNVVEDARIERKMKLKFPGMRRDFVVGYEDLHCNRDFFGLENTDISTLGLGDRINLHYKIGDQISIPFTAEERKILVTIDATESFDDVIDVVGDLYDTINEEQQQLQSTDAEDADATFSDNHENGELGDSDVQVGAGGANDESGDEAGNSGQSDSDPSDDDSSDENVSGDDSGDCGDSMDDDTDDGSSAESDDQNGGGDDTGASLGCGLSTVDAAEKAMEALREDDRYVRDNTYVEFADYDASDWIISHEGTYKGLVSPDVAQLKQQLDRKVAKGANLLAKQFDMKKAADAHKRTVISKTGVLDTVKMVNYKFSDDIFRQNATVTEDKNHGLVCFIDWSGSMHNDMAATMEQLYLLATFCKKANIPFDFYAFSSQTPWKTNDDPTYSYNRIEPENRLTMPAGPAGNDGGDAPNKIRPSASMCLYHLVSSSMTNKIFNTCMGHLASIHAHYDSMQWDIKMPSQLHLGGTPLDDCIVLARDIVNEFRRKHGLQIVHGIFLTDGDSHGGCVSSSTHIRENRKNYETKDAKSSRYYGNSTKKLLEWFRATTDAKAIGIFLTSTATVAMRNAGVKWSEEKATKKLFLKNKFIAPGAKHGYSEYFILKSDTKVETGSFDDMDSDMSTTKLKSAFIKSQSQSITSRTVLNRIADLIAEV